MLGRKGWCIDPHALSNGYEGEFSCLPILHKKMKVCLSWDVSPRTGHVVFCKKLRDEDLHSFKGMIGYCVKGNGEEHYECVHDNVSANDTNDGKMEYVKFGNFGLDNSVSLSHCNVTCCKGLLNGLVFV